MAIQCCYFPSSLFFKWSKHNEENEKQKGHFWQMGEMVKIASPKREGCLKKWDQVGVHWRHRDVLWVFSQDHFSGGREPLVGHKFLLGHSGDKKACSSGHHFLPPQMGPIPLFLLISHQAYRFSSDFPESQILAFFSLFWHYFLFY